MVPESLGLKGVALQGTPTFRGQRAFALRPRHPMS
jgi:hypothetical protein